MRHTPTHPFGLRAGSIRNAGPKNLQFLSIKGSARKDVEFNLVIWNGLLTTEAGTLLKAHKKLKEDACRVEQFLRNRQMTNFNFTLALE